MKTDKDGAEVVVDAAWPTSGCWRLSRSSADAQCAKREATRSALSYARPTTPHRRAPRASLHVATEAHLTLHVTGELNSFGQIGCGKRLANRFCGRRWQSKLLPEGDRPANSTGQK
jgi:hypothetical protein